MNRTLIHAAFVIAVVGIGIAIGYIFLPGAWYQGLIKPVFNPPNWVFAPAWTTLYIFIGIAGARTWLAGAEKASMKLWSAQMLLNYMWSPTFFGLHNPELALPIIVLLLVTILSFIAVAWRRDRISALLFLPYGAWVTFATTLNASIAYLN